MKEDRILVTRTVELFGQWCEMSESELIDLIRRKISELREELRHSVKFSISTGTTYPELIMTYKSPETDTEYAGRLANERLAIAQKMESDRLEFERLSKLFGIS